jgi:hypothetical protein
MPAGAIPIATVEDLAFVQDDRLQEPVLADVGNELSELGTVDREQREQVGGWVELQLGGRSELVSRLVGGGLHTTYSRERGGRYPESARRSRCPGCVPRARR